MTYSQGSQWGGRAQTRAATTDRDRAVELLQKAYAAGRLTKDEYDTRLGRALSAVTYADLDAVVADLPMAHPGAGMPAAPAVPMAYPGMRRTNGLATASLVCGILGFLFGPLSIAAIVMGYIARGQIRRTGENGSGLALAGLILGWIWLGVVVVLIVFIVAIASVHPATGAIRG
jgi:uncharacterized membrane protein